MICSASLLQETFSVHFVFADDEIVVTIDDKDGEGRVG